MGETSKDRENNNLRLSRKSSDGGGHTGKKPVMYFRHRCNKYRRIYSLPYYDEVYDKLRRGWSLSRVSKMIQDRGDCLDVTFGTLRCYLHKFRNEKIPKSDIIREHVPRLVMDAEEKFKEGMDELEEMEDLYRVQRERIGIDYKKEKMIGKLFNNTHKEMEVCLAMLQASAKLKQDLGLTKKELGTINVESKHILEAQDKYGTSEVQKVIANPSSRRKVLMLAEKIMSNSDFVGDGDVDEGNVIDADAEVVPASQDAE